MSVACIPLTFLFLGNQYKGENIEKLTSDAHLIPYDTFADLIENNFKILAKPKHLHETEYRELIRTLKIKRDYFQESKHEMFPGVLELWYEIMLRWDNFKWKKLADLKNEISEKSWWYLNNSEMIVPETMNSFHDDITRHLALNNKTAVIMEEEDAILAYVVRNKTFSLYLGKEVINENLLG